VREKTPGPGKGPTNLSGVRGASPVIRFRAPEELKAAAEEKAERTGEDLNEVMRDLLRRWVGRK
jgi:hypothetical protein